METLPTGIHSFRMIREHELRYVDKTGYAMRLVNRGRRFFLSRPRRFGKSLFVNTLKELFEGNEKLFRGLAIHGKWDWSTRYPVIRLDFGAGQFSKQGVLKERIFEMLDQIETETGQNSGMTSFRRILQRIAGLAGSYPNPRATTVEGRFTELIRSLKKRTGRPVVVLVDEYDKPILAAVGGPEIARDNRETLQSLYSVLKAEDDNIRFCFVTGVTMFSQASLFSGANHLTDISLEPEYSAICGYTESDLDSVFAEELAGLDREEVRNWYNGYSWRGKERVYNPYAILLLFGKREFKAWWYRSGTPKFLIDVMKRRGVLPVALESMAVTDSAMEASDIDSLSTEALLFQTGYLTIVEEDKLGNVSNYRLGYPNREVRQSLNESLISSLMPNLHESLKGHKIELRALFQDGRIERLQPILQSIFAGIPHQWHAASKATNYETYFASVVYGIFIGAGLDIRVEDSTNEGRIDLAVVEKANVYLFEFKAVNGFPSGASTIQLRSKNYADKYRWRGAPIHLAGVEFSKETRNVALFNVEQA